ncbi:hypothetical protein CHS0354_036713 [Potamilus streckersoni]|uniref:Immunoglobulin I-set domain-containing protein n=1 Tax=Potamilus streckersoni TaxID=2493646 RepID=A0AAE0WC30_9BIVA|nr:hypothetical protein CHS0354_036713 [Potamilus streckersoni]
MKVKGSGVPQPKVWWLTEDLKSEYNITAKENGLVQELHIRHSSPYDNGWLQCNAENDAIRSTETVRFKVNDIRMWEIYLILQHTRTTSDIFDVRSTVWYFT